jgi:hypothetical protein
MSAHFFDQDQIFNKDGILMQSKNQVSTNNLKLTTIGSIDNIS